MRYIVKSFLIFVFSVPVFCSESPFTQIFEQTFPGSRGGISRFTEVIRVGSAVRFSIGDGEFGARRVRVFEFVDPSRPPRQGAVPLENEMEYSPVTFFQGSRVVMAVSSLKATGFYDVTTVETPTFISKSPLSCSRKPAFFRNANRTFMGCASKDIVKVWDISDLKNPKGIAFFRSETSEIVDFRVIRVGDQNVGQVFSATGSYAFLNLTPTAIKILYKGEMRDAKWVATPKAKLRFGKEVFLNRNGNFYILRYDVRDWSWRNGYVDLEVGDFEIDLSNLNSIRVNQKKLRSSVFRPTEGRGLAISAQPNDVFLDFGDGRVSVYELRGSPLERQYRGALDRVSVGASIPVVFKRENATFLALHRNATSDWHLLDITNPLKPRVLDTFEFYVNEDYETIELDAVTQYLFMWNSARVLVFRVN